MTCFFNGDNPTIALHFKELAEDSKNQDDTQENRLYWKNHLEQAVLMDVENFLFNIGKGNEQEYIDFLVKEYLERL